MNANPKRQLNHFLHVLASFYMDKYQGDILLSHQDIVDDLTAYKEVECYVHKDHFDTENRFEWTDGSGRVKTREEAREYAHKEKWGQYNIMLRVENRNDLVVSIQKTADDAPNFPISRLEDSPLAPILRDCRFNNEYGKEETR